MLEPRGADIPVLFLVLVVLPLVAYILLGKWSESAKKRERISLLAQLAAEEAFRAEVMATACIIPPMSTSKNGIHVCARCFSPATTRCSRCKSVRYWYFNCPFSLDKCVYFLLLLNYPVSVCPGLNKEIFVILSVFP
jgi:ubiquitin carboxyl-terminal hydrolase 36/42